MSLRCMRLSLTTPCLRREPFSEQAHCLPQHVALGSAARRTERLVQRFDAQQIAQRKELAAKGETFLKTLSAKLGLKDSDLKKQLNNMLKKAEQEKKQAAKKVRYSVRLSDRHKGEESCASRAKARSISLGCLCRQSQLPALVRRWRRRRSTHGCIGRIESPQWRSLR